MWPGAALLVFFFYSVSPIPAQIQIRESACLIEGASHAGGRLWLVCEEGKVLAGSPSQDGWTQIAVPARSPLRDIAFLDERRGFIVGDRGLILASEDGGKRWREVKSPTEENLTAVFFRGERGWAAGWSGVVLHSADGGRSWQLQKTGISQGLEGIYFLDDSRGWAVGWVGTILRTVDGGQTWKQVSAPDARWSLNAVYFRDADHGWIVGFGGQILRSRDGGQSWEVQASPVTSSLTSVAFDASGRGWITTVDGVLASDDGGETWVHRRLGDWLFLNGLVTVEGSVWAYGARGILRPEGGEFRLDRIEQLLARAS